MFEPLNFSHLPGLLLSPLHRGGRLSPGCPIPACLPVAMILGDIIYHLETALHELIAQVMAGAEPGLWTSTTNPAYTPSTALPPRVITLDPHSHCAPVLSSHPPHRASTVPWTPRRPTSSTCLSTAPASGWALGGAGTPTHIREGRQGGHRGCQAQAAARPRQAPPYEREQGFW